MLTLWLTYSSFFFFIYLFLLYLLALIVSSEIHHSYTGFKVPAYHASYSESMTHACSSAFIRLALCSLFTVTEQGHLVISKLTALSRGTKDTKWSSILKFVVCSFRDYPFHVQIVATTVLIVCMPLPMCKQSFKSMELIDPCPSQPWRFLETHPEGIAYLSRKKSPLRRVMKNSWSASKLNGISPGPCTTTLRAAGEVGSVVLQSFGTVKVENNSSFCHFISICLELDWVHPSTKLPRLCPVVLVK